MPEPGAESVRRGQTQPAATQVLVEHGGTWWPADVLDHYRAGDQGRWRVVPVDRPGFEMVADTEVHQVGAASRGVLNRIARMATQIGVMIRLGMAIGRR
jgi:hypothetical protein